MTPAYHHDGSDLYVSTRAPELGEAVTVFVRGAAAAGVHRVWVRTVADGEPSLVPAVLDRRAGRELWWRATVRVHNLVTRYRFLLEGRGGHHWLTAAGVVDHDVPDDTDFRLVAYPAPPAWTAEAVVYQIFPDRFARSSAAAERAAPGWAIPCDWDTPVIGRGPETPRQFYGGDLDGIVEHLDHVQDLGADTVYLTPVFPAPSNHRYNASSFDEIDPLLGGEKALDRLATALRERGMRLVGDLTTNHTGDTHTWFTGPDAADLYCHDVDGGFVRWLDVPTLPKLDWGSAALRARFLDGPDAVATRWLDQLDGWRIDVANMTGRFGAADHNHEASRLIATAVRAARPDALLVAEYTNDATGDLDVGGWPGTMNYAGFTFPVWSWLRRAPTRMGRRGGPAPTPLRHDGAAVVAAMRAFLARASWRSVMHSWTILDSHDTARFGTVTGDPDLVEVGLGLQVAHPGVPMVFAGAEFGMAGDFGEDSRRPMLWARPERWHRPTLDRHRALLALRREQPALVHGGLRFAHVGPDALAFWRETPSARLLVLVRRAAGRPVRVHSVKDGFSVYGGAALDISGDVATLPGDGPTVQIWSCR